MGREENDWFRTDREAARIRKIAEAAADRAAVWAMAEEATPPDVRDWCARWRIAQLGEFLWCNAFVAGWRLAMNSRLLPRENHKGRPQMQVTYNQHRIAAHLNLHPDPEIGGWPMRLIDRIIAIEERDGPGERNKICQELLRRPDKIPPAEEVADLIGKQS